MQLLQTVQKIDKHIAYIYYLKGIIFKETGDTVKAIENFQIAIDKEPDFYNIHILLGKIYADRNDSIAIAYYKNAIRIIPGSIEAHYDLGIYYQEAGRAADAINEYEYIIENIDSAYPYAYHNIGFIYMEHFCNFEKAIAYFDKSAMLAPDYVEAVYHRGLCYETMQQYEKARADYRRTLDIVPNYRYGIDGLNRIDDKLH
ncbi:MAG: tetratricopeptide repeat protein [Bacteroidetes bacterium]|nr:tetratricopeptide repeat protein [Bacteroidota bacterium]